MAHESDLDRAARQFAHRVRALLNTTVCDRAHIGVSAPASDGWVNVGTGLHHRQASPAFVPLRPSGQGALWLKASYRLFLDQTEHLTVQSSTYVLAVGEQPEELLHYDYERGKVGYPEAHVQIRASSPAWDALLRPAGLKAGSLHKLHLPVGGRRYRPSLEDLIEGLVQEGVLAPSPGWRAALDHSRDEFRRRQLMAAIRRDPGTGAHALRDEGFAVLEPVEVVPRPREEASRREA